MFPLLIHPTRRSVAAPNCWTFQVYDQLDRPDAVCHDAPLSVDTSTPATSPPTSDAVPEIVTDEPACTVVPAAGLVVEHT